MFVLLKSRVSFLLSAVHVAATGFPMSQKEAYIEDDLIVFGNLTQVQQNGSTGSSLSSCVQSRAEKRGIAQREKWEA